MMDLIIHRRREGNMPRRVQIVELREIVQRLRLGQSVKAIHQDTGRHKTVIRAVRDLALREGWLDVRTEIPSEGEIARLYGEAMIVVTLTYDPAACTGCGRCWEVCPHGVFMPDSDRVNGGKALLTDRDLCMECGACEANCRFGAIKVKSGVGCAAAIINGALNGREPSCGCGGESKGAAEAGGCGEAGQAAGKAGSAGSNSAAAASDCGGAAKSGCCN
jgi:ferredoxin